MDQEFNVDNVWILVLIARKYVLSCIAYRTLIGRSRTDNKDLADATARKLGSVTFELGTVIDRIVVHDVARYCPLFM
jgi:hypothetical protein